MAALLRITRMLARQCPTARTTDLATTELSKSQLIKRTFSSSRPVREDISEVKISDRLSLKGKSVLITGGGRGIGFAICRAVAQQGGNVAALDTLSEPVAEFHELESRYGIKASFHRADVTKERSLQDAFEQAASKVGPFQGCVPAAGIAVDAPILETSWEDAYRVLAVNVVGTWGTTRAFASHVKQHGQGGSIVMIASVAGQGIKIPEQNLAIYNMSKAGVKGVVGPLAVELSELDIRVNSISPGVILSPMTEALKTQYPKLLNMFENAAPARRIGIPQDLTPAVIYLLSDASSFTTGADIPITGGLHAGIAPQLASKAFGARS